jgi:cyclomaltodextrinase / maltogenic alpha-amylase / neopullulanase
MYSSNYHQHPQGFIYYFWKDLVNLNYNNEEVQELIIDACKYWIRKFDIDGYRFDAVWGVNARAPLFGKRLQLELKSLKPDLLLLAEDKASAARAYRQGFDAAYDWAEDTGWVSHWSWQYAYDELHQQTLFNHPSITMRKVLLEKALFSDGDSVGLRLRFLENNDQHRFITNHSLEVTKMAATLLFGLSGLPMLYNGQEIGCRAFPYTSAPIFQRDKTIRSLNPALFDFYKRLVEVRKDNEALNTGTLSEIQTKGGQGVVAFLRSSGYQNIIAVTNMADRPTKVKLKLMDLRQRKGTKVHLKDLYAGHTLIMKVKGKGNIRVPITAYTTKLLKFVNVNIQGNSK